MDNRIVINNVIYDNKNCTVYIDVKEDNINMIEGIKAFDGEMNNPLAYINPDIIKNADWVWTDSSAPIEEEYKSLLIKELETIYNLRNQAYNATIELISVANDNDAEILVVGCSTSEISGEKIGSSSKPYLARAVFTGIWEAAKKNNLYLAAQCCEHLNRALIIEKELAKKRNLEIVNVVPWPKAGGSFATMAYAYFDNPVAVEHIKADIGMDIGDTLIGMHLKDVCVPVRLSVNSIGDAHLVCARTRAKFIGGERARYQ